MLIKIVNFPAFVVVVGVMPYIQPSIITCINIPVSATDFIGVVQQDFSQFVCVDFDGSHGLAPSLVDWWFIPHPYN
jgi:hypothetical protein